VYKATRYLVCLLAVGVFVLASLAKCSQYSEGSPSYFAKATKMSGDRGQTAAAVVPVIVPQVRPSEPAVRVRVAVRDPLLPPPVFLDSFRFRPPPARVA
jgi:hypothetical protein